MFRSHSDRRLLPSITSSPSLGNYMALESRDGMISAPCIPEPIHPRNKKARLSHLFLRLLLHSHSVPSFTQIPKQDEISDALGLQNEHVLQYEQPRPALPLDSMISGLQALTLDDLEYSDGSMDTASSRHVLRGSARNSNKSPRNGSLMTSKAGSAMGSEKSSGRGSGRGSNHSGHTDRMSSVEMFIQQMQKTEEAANFLEKPEKPDPASLPPPSQPKSWAPDLFSRLNRKRLRTESHSSRGSLGSRGQSESPRDLVRTLVNSARTIKAAKLGHSGVMNPAFVTKDMAELQYLVTYNLVNNFYFNLVSWAPLNNSIAIAIEDKAYWWDGSSQVRDMQIHRENGALVTCVASSRGNTLAVSFSDGLLAIYEILLRKPATTRKFASAVQCVEWFPDSKRLYAGDLAGMVRVLVYDGLSIQILSHLSAFSQQICGISLSSDGTQVAVGANENLAIVWDISNESDPQQKCRLRHKLAVKGVHFCPWAPNLLATGGGSNDRHLRFWHTGSGTLLNEFDTKRQITSVFWSSFYKEILVTFGFLTTDDNVVAAVYHYPEIRVVSRAQARDPLRALSATVSPDQTKLAVAANDGTVRVFGLWENRPYALTGSPSSVAVGSYGSAVVESVEGLDLRAPPLR